MKHCLSSAIWLVLISCILSCTSSQQQQTTSENTTPTYEPSWESLAQHQEAPQWFQDAKLGIYFHWGVYSVPAFGSEWYPRWMHFENSREYKHHLATYGHPSEFGYHDFVPLFKAEHFDAAEWADLFQQAGARFAGPVAEHHDGFSMWDSEVTPWNVADKGPQKDITGLLAKELRARDMKLITTFHHARNLQRHQSVNTENPDQVYWDSHYPFFEEMAPASDDAELKYLYGNIPEEEWLENVWFAKVNEVVEKYQPDIIWFDSWLDKIPETYRQRMAANYLNKAEEWGKEVVIVRKQNDLPLDMSVDDLEKSRKNELDEKTWMTDETVSKGSWCYTENLEIKTPQNILHVLIDIVSKNGVLLLNVSPKADGTIPDNQKAVLVAMGQWLDQYGTSIYATKPWYTYGEGPTKEPEGHFSNHEAFTKLSYTDEDIRYATKGNTIYATILGVPEQGRTYNLTAFATNNLPNPLELESVALLDGGQVDWHKTEQGLQITLSDAPKDDKAVVLKIETE